MFQADESGCEADMAEGGQEDDSGDVTTMSPHKLDAGDAPLNLKSEVSRFKIPAKNIRNVSSGPETAPAARCSSIDGL